ncbi:MAG: hypothetical protein BJ554DRAFT_4693 [Olpidium bornovanus]|uniref:Uncharacterized protein n=1 Tax=Olpidium bornovanus TaxID=278681 RepID=A0A8H7ZMF5_9FUNG|nr:MAG: hypothetical protein BJ554DRAFT_4693 [Olpidium bornovanus]
MVGLRRRRFSPRPGRRRIMAQRDVRARAFNTVYNISNVPALRQGFSRIQPFLIAESLMLLPGDHAESGATFVKIDIGLTEGHTLEFSLFRQDIFITETSAFDKASGLPCEADLEHPTSSTVLSTGPRHCSCWPQRVKTDIRG